MAASAAGLGTPAVSQPASSSSAASSAAGSGASLFDEQCGSCHTVGPASDPLAPTLKGVFGRKIAGRADFAYSDALKAKGGTWNQQTLDVFLTDPASFAPGTQMYAGAPDPATRQAIIDYLKTVQ